MEFDRSCLQTPRLAEQLALGFCDSDGATNFGSSAVERSGIPGKLARCSNQCRMTRTPPFIISIIGSGDNDLVHDCGRLVRYVATCWQDSVLMFLCKLLFGNACAPDQPTRHETPNTSTQPMSLIIFTSPPRYLRC